MSYFSAVKLRNFLGTIINPATEEKQDILNAHLTTIEGYVDGVESELVTLNLKDFATQSTLALVKAKTDNIDVAISTRTKPSDQQHAIVDSSSLPIGASTDVKQDTTNLHLSSIEGYVDGIEGSLASKLSESDFDTKTGSLTETAPATDTASSGLNGRAQRIAQNITTLNGKNPTDVHQRVHNGTYFTTADNTNLGNGGIRNILFSIGTKTAHFFCDIKAFNTSSQKTFTVDFYELTTVSANGTSIIINNLNRNSVITPLTAVYHTPTITADGTSIMQQRTGKDSVSFVIRQGEEYDLKASTNYLIRVTSLVNNNDIQTNIGFYEP